jgi:tetratricopeptide (TPR) repeat protein
MEPTAFTLRGSAYMGEKRVEWLEMVMRILPIAGALGIMAALMASSGQSQAPENQSVPAAVAPDSQLNPTSVSLLRQGEAALAAGNFVAADDAFETALAVDPRNRQAFINLAQVAQRQKLYGQAVRYTNKALALEPTDVNALAIQGEAMVEMGATARAQQNLAKVRQLCGANSCAQATRLSAAIARGPAVAQKAPTPGTKTN